MDAIKIHPLHDVPANFPEFASEISDGLTVLYGAEAGADYRAKAHRVFSANLSHPDVKAWGYRENDTTTGFLLSVRRPPVAELSFVHVLETASEPCIEGELVRFAVEYYRARGALGIVCDFSPASALNLSEPFQSLGFERIERQLMAAPLDAAALTMPAEPPTTPLESGYWVDAASCIVDAYEGHPGRRLHHEVRTLENALGFVSSVSSGSYGLISPGYQRAILDGEECAGVLLGCQAAPKTGFVLQIAVRRAYQNCGYGTALLRDFARALRSAGMERIALGVTCDNPARQLYERLGFALLRRTEAFTWWAS